jgi:hypothetical protein
VATVERTAKAEEVLPWAAAAPIVPLEGDALDEKRLQAELYPDSVPPQLLHASGVRLACAATYCPDGKLPAPWMTLAEADALRRKAAEEAEAAEEEEPDAAMTEWYAYLRARGAGAAR